MLLSISIKKVMWYIKKPYRDFVDCFGVLWVQESNFRNDVYLLSVQSFTTQTILIKFGMLAYVGHILGLLIFIFLNFWVATIRNIKLSNDFDQNLLKYSLYESKQYVLVAISQKSICELFGYIKSYIKTRSYIKNKNKIIHESIIHKT